MPGTLIGRPVTGEHIYACLTIFPPGDIISLQSRAFMFPQQDADNSPATDNKHLPHNTPMTPMNTLNRTLMALALAGATLTAIAQTDDGGRPPGGPGGPGGPEGGRPRMVSPLMEALDTNRDGVIDADELKNASASLLKLDKNGDGKLTQDELRPSRPPGGRGPGGPGGPGGPDREGRTKGEGRPTRPEQR